MYIRILSFSTKNIEKVFTSIDISILSCELRNTTQIKGFNWFDFRYTCIYKDSFKYIDVKYSKISNYNFYIVSGVLESYETFRHSIFRKILNRIEGFMFSFDNFSSQYYLKSSKSINSNEVYNLYKTFNYNLNINKGLFFKSIQDFLCVQKKID